MCKFCYKIGENKKDITWEVRSCYADQNIDEEYGEYNDNNRTIKKERFKLTPYKLEDGKVKISVDYRMETSDNIVISPFSESIPLSFCPFCGKQLNKDIIKVEDIYSHQFNIEDEDYDMQKALDLLEESE